jgi:hypothetical protein
MEGLLGATCNLVLDSFHTQGLHIIYLEGLVCAKYYLVLIVPYLTCCRSGSLFKHYEGITGESVVEGGKLTQP